MGAKQICLTVHHTGGFALWPTKASNYSIAASPFAKTGRDIVGEFVDSCRSHELEPCFYIILDWDCHEWRDDVQTYYRVQQAMLTELLTNYNDPTGRFPIARLWWDNYNMAGSSIITEGRLAKTTQRSLFRTGDRGTDVVPGHNPGGFPALFANLTEHVRMLSPSTLLIPGPDGCLVGGEGGGGAYPIWNFNSGPTQYGCQGNTAGVNPTPSPSLIYAPHEQDHSILNPGDMWWWVKGHPWLSAAELFEHYLVSVGRGSSCVGLYR